MAKAWQEWVDKGWQALRIDPGQESSEKLSYDPDAETAVVKNQVYDPRTGLQYSGHRPECHIEDDGDGGRLVLDEPLGRACVFLVRVQARSTAEEDGGEDEAQEEDFSSDEDLETPEDET